MVPIGLVRVKIRSPTQVWVVFRLTLTAVIAEGTPATVAVLVADAGLGVIDSVRKSMLALSPLSPLVYLNRFDPNDELHRLNRRWLSERDRIETWVDMDEFVDAVLVASRGEP